MIRFFLLLVGFTFLLSSAYGAYEGKDSDISQLRPYIGLRYCRNKKYQNNLSEFLESFEVKKSVRSVVKVVKPCIKISQDENGQMWVSARLNRAMSKKLAFKFGEDFVVKDEDKGDTVVSLKVDGNKVYMERLYKDASADGTQPLIKGELEFFPDKTMTFKLTYKDKSTIVSFKTKDSQPSATEFETDNEAEED